jgi:hypothetical protein
MDGEVREKRVGWKREKTNMTRRGIMQKNSNNMVIKRKKKIFT